MHILLSVIFTIYCFISMLLLQCFDALGWAAGRAYLGSPGKGAVKRVCVCVVCYYLILACSVVWYAPS